MSRFSALGPAALAAMALTACSDQARPTEPDELAAKPLFDLVGPVIVPGLLTGPTIVSAAGLTATPGHAAFCKAGAAGQITITIRQQGTGVGTVPQPTDPIVFQHTLTLQAGQCAVFHAGAPQQFTFHAHEAQQFTIGGTVIVLTNITATTIGSTVTPVACGTNATDLCVINMGPGNVTVGGVQYPPGSVIFGEINFFHGGLATFHNQVHVGGHEGCTPGFWKNHLTAFEGTGITPGTSLNTFFGVSIFGSLTFEQALNEGGGGIDALARHAAAAALNAAHSGVDFDLTTAQVITIVRRAAGVVGPSLSVEAAKDMLAAENESGCPLSGFPNTNAGGNSNSARQK